MAMSWCFEDEWTPDSDRVLQMVRDNGSLVPPPTLDTKLTAAASQAGVALA